ncbi:MAG: type II toxin-antitoxin system PemK/MazF family toxin [Caldilineaceae bacterium]|nr:type II toxin-antitoxin system PemK/MazF family toxin [Caldilineaceae bacterium]
MVATTNISISIQETVSKQAESLARHLNLSPSRLFEIAIEDFIKNYPSQPTRHETSGLASRDAEVAVQGGRERRVINQGDIYWIRLDNPAELEPAIPHPYVVIQDNLFNHSRIHTVVVCALTSNRRRVSDTPGNLLLEAGEANLPKQSVVEVSKVSTVDKTALGEYIGSLTEQRITQILAGMRFLQNSFGRMRDEG